MQHVLCEADSLNIIAGMYEADPLYQVQMVGAMEIHEGRHPDRGQILVIREINGGQSVVIPKPRPNLSLVRHPAA